MGGVPSYEFGLATAGSGYEGNAALCFASLGLENPPLLMSIVEGLRGSITSQIAVRMSMDAILEEALRAAGNPQGAYPIATEIVRQTVKEANSQVYEYAHRMGRGGSMGAIGAVACYSGERVTMARLGSASAYVLRAGKLASLFEVPTEPGVDRPGELRRYLGANSQVLVDLASAELELGDVFLCSSFHLSETCLGLLPQIVAGENSLDAAARKILLQAIDEETNLLERPAIVCLLQVGRPTIVLKNVVTTS